jgi:hypothetical protein
MLSGDAAVLSASSVCRSLRGGRQQPICWRGGWLPTGQRSSKSSEPLLCLTNINQIIFIIVVVSFLCYTQQRGLNEWHQQKAFLLLFSCYLFTSKTTHACFSSSHLSFFPFLSYLSFHLLRPPTYMSTADLFPLLSCHLLPLGILLSLSPLPIFPLSSLYVPPTI